MRKQSGNRKTHLYALASAGVLLVFIAVLTDGFKYFTAQDWGITAIFCLIFYAIPVVVVHAIRTLMGR